MNCRACNLEAVDGSWCSRHALAEKNLQKKYSVWVNAYQQMSWADYLKQLLTNTGTGEWVREVARVHLSGL